MCTGLKNQTSSTTQAVLKYKEEAKPLLFFSFLFLSFPLLSFLFLSFLTFDDHETELENWVLGDGYISMSIKAKQRKERESEEKEKQSMSE